MSGGGHPARAQGRDRAGAACSATGRSSRSSSCWLLVILSELVRPGIVDADWAGTIAAGRRARWRSSPAARR